MITISEFEGIQTRRVQNAESARKIDELEKRFAVAKEAYNSVEERLKNLESILESLEAETKLDFKNKDKSQPIDSKNAQLHLMLMDEFVYLKMDSMIYYYEMQKYKALISHFSSIPRILTEDICNAQINGSHKLSQEDIKRLTSDMIISLNDDMFKEKVQEIIKSGKISDILDKVFG